MKAIIQTPTSNLKDSLEFYSKLKFKIISKENPTLVSDGSVIIEINNDRYARCGIKLFSTNWKKAYDKLENITSILKIANGYLLVDPNGMYIYMIEIKDIPDMDFPGITPSVLGNYAGVSIECIDLRKSEEFWKLLGFEKSMGSIEQGWITMVNNVGMTLSLMIANSCPHLFYTPSLTYFNGKSNLAIIEKIKELSVPITEEITHFNDEDVVDNIIIRDPGGLGFFIFND